VCQVVQRRGAPGDSRAARGAAMAWLLA